MKKRKDTKEVKTGLLRHAAVGAVIGLAVTLLLILVFSLTVSTGLVSQSLQDSLVVFCVVIGTAAGGLYCAGKQGGGVVTAGMLSAVGYIALVLIVTMLVAGRDGQEGILMKVIIAAVAGGTFGGVLRLNRKNQKSRLRK